MLPWIFAVLVLLNAGLFYWGYEREKSLEPPAAPVPAGSFEIRLVGERSEAPKEAADDEDTNRETRDSEGGEGVLGGAGEQAIDGPAVPDDPGRVGESAAAETSIPTEDPEPDEEAAVVTSSGSANLQAEPSYPEPEPEESEAFSEESPAIEPGPDVPDGAIEATEIPEVKASVASDEKPYGKEVQTTGASNTVIHEEPPASLPVPAQTGPSPEVREAKELQKPENQVESAVTSPPERLQTDKDEATTGELLDDER